MLRIYVCDDEEETARRMVGYVEAFLFDHPEEYSVSAYHSGTALLAQVRQARADILFLDIELGDGNGIAVAKAIRQLDKRVKIIFVTSHRNYKGAAFSVRAFGYVDKPAEKAAVQAQLRDALRYMAEETRDAQKVHFKTEDGAMGFDPADILYLENDNRKIKLVTFTGSHRMKGKLSSLEKQLSALGFASPHVSFLVNLDYVSDIRNYTVYLVDGTEIPMSQRKAAAFRQAVDLHLALIIRRCKEAQHE